MLCRISPRIIGETDVSNTLIIRADAGGALGTGHVMRMIALSQAYSRRGGKVMIASVQCPPPVIERIEELGIEHRLLNGCSLGDEEDATATLALCLSEGAHWMVLDGYHFDETYQKAVSDHGVKVLVVDDYGHCKTWHCDAVLNQNLGAEKWDRGNTTNPDTQWMLGSSYALIREEFLKSIRNAQEKPLPARRILVTMGGSDPENVTRKVLENLEHTDLKDLEIRALIGGANPHKKPLEEFVQESRHRIELLSNVRDMPSMYEWTDAVISAGGSTCWEWLAYGLPGAVVTIADNQEPVVSELQAQNLALCLGWHTQFTMDSCSQQLENWLEGEQRVSTFDQRRHHIDGHGATRAAAFLDGGVWSRPAQRHDAQIYFDWANDPAVRSNGFHTQKLEWENHCRWFEKMIQASDSYLYLVSDACNKPIGQVRLTPDPSGHLEIGFSIDAAFRKKGLGLTLLQHTITKHSATHPNTSGFMARVKKTNQASARIFETLNFQLGEDDPELGCLIYLKTY